MGVAGLDGVDSGEGDNDGVSVAGGGWKEMHGFVALDGRPIQGIIRFGKLVFGEAERQGEGVRGWGFGYTGEDDSRFR